jgi:hypothetical protein
MQIDLHKIKEMARDARDLNGYVDDFLENKCTPDDPPFLSDAITGFNAGGVHVMEALALRFENDRNRPLEKRFRWKLQVLRDEWGNKPQIGDVFKFDVQRPLQHSPGKPVNANELNIDIMNGSYRKKWIDEYEYPVDEKGCITVEFQHASSLLTRFGIHGHSGHNMSIHKVEHSGDPVTGPDGQKRFVWYWRLRESDRDDYAKLPVIGSNTGDKRGYPKKAE